MDELIDVNEENIVSKKNSIHYNIEGISFNASPGDCIGIIGVDGPEKNMVLNAVINSSSSKKETDKQGALVSFTENFNDSLTGLKNVDQYLSKMGLKKQKRNIIANEIIDFAELGDYIEQPVNTYSKGMKMRLSFAMSVYQETDILMIDEGNLSLVDDIFYQKCLNKILELKENGKTIFLFSHSLDEIEFVCNKVLWLHNGTIRMFDSIQQVIPVYNAYLTWYKGLTTIERINYQEKNGLINEPHSLTKFFMDYDYPIQTEERTQKKIKRQKFKIRRKAILLLAVLAIFSGFLILSNYALSNQFLSFFNGTPKNQTKVVRSIPEPSSETSNNEPIESTSTLQTSDILESFTESSIEQEVQELEGEQTYTVQSGDTLDAIASAYQVSIDDLIEINELDSNFIDIGQILLIPQN